MSNALTLFDNPKLAIPDHLRDLNDEGNILDKVTTPSLSYEGKTWAISINGERTPLMRRDADGDEMPLAVMRVVVLDYTQRRGRAYYPGAYDPAKASQPECWSDDGIAPSSNVVAPKCSTCADCPLSAKGSKVSEQGKAVSACSQHRLLAVVPASKLDMEPLRLKLAVTSDYDKTNEMEAQGWFAFQQYRDFLSARQIKHTALLVTKMRFDPNTAYPKVLFSPDRWIEPHEKAIVNPLVKSDAVADLLAGTWTPAGVEGRKTSGAAVDVDVDEDEDAPVVSAKAKAKAQEEALLKAEVERKMKADAAKKVKAEAAKKVKAAEDDEGAEVAKTRAAKAAAAAKKPVVEDDDDEEAAALAALERARAKKAAAAKAAAADADAELTPPKAVGKGKADAVDGQIVDGPLPDEVSELLQDWEDD